RARRRADRQPRLHRRRGARCPLAGAEPPGRHAGRHHPQRRSRRRRRSPRRAARWTRGRVIPRSQLRARDLLALATISVRTRRARATLSALGIAIGIAAIVAVLSVTRSSEANLLAQIDRLGTNLLTVVNGQSIQGVEAELPTTASVMIRRV